MKKLLGLALVATVLVSCGGKKAETAEVETVVVESLDNARTSLDYQGAYKGVLPCADCDSIITVVAITDAVNYAKAANWYKNGTIVASDEAVGTYSWNEAGNTITLNNEKDTPNQYFVGENKLTQLDMEGNVITGALADNYILTKIQ